MDKDQRIRELIEANNREVERRRAAERERDSVRLQLEAVNLQNVRMLEESRLPERFCDIMESDNVRDSIIERLVGSLISHPAFNDCTSSLIYELHGPNWAIFRSGHSRIHQELPEMKWR